MRRDEVSLGAGGAGGSGGGGRGGRGVLSPSAPAERRRAAAPRGPAR